MVRTLSTVEKALADLEAERGKVEGQIVELEQRLDVLAPQAGQAKADAEAGDLVGRLRLLERKRDQFGARVAELEAERGEAAVAAEHEARMAALQGLKDDVASLKAQRAEIGRLAVQLAEALKAEAAAHERILAVGRQVDVWTGEREAQGRAAGYYDVYSQAAPEAAIRRGEFDPQQFRLETVDGQPLWPPR